MSVTSLTGKTASAPGPCGPPLTAEQFLEPRHDWRREEVLELFARPFMELLYLAHSVHRARFDPGAIQVSTLLSIKTGACPEDCAYCPQSTRFDTGLSPEALMEVEEVLAAARAARANGSTRFCMGAAWRSPKDRDLPKLLAMIEGVKALGLETCMTLGMLSAGQARALADAGLDYYNHNLDTSPEYYGEIISTRTYDDRLHTLEHVRRAGMNVCAGGIVGMGESVSDRAGLLQQLANLPEHPQSVPINQLVRVAGTPLEQVEEVDGFDFIRTLAVARLMMPASVVRLSAGRDAMNDEMQALAFFAGANSIFYGEQLLTTSNPETNSDQSLFARLDLRASFEHELTETPVAAGTASRQQLYYDAATVPPAELHAGS